MTEDIRTTTDTGPGSKTGSGAGAARRTGRDRPDSWDAPGVTPSGRRTGSPTDGPRTAMDGEGEPDPGQHSEKEA